MNNMNMMGANEADPEEARKDRIKAYKSILNYYRGRSLSLDVILASKQFDTGIPPNMKTMEELQKNIQGLHEDICLVLTLKECVKHISNSITCQQIMESGDSSVLGRIMHKIEGIVYFSKSIMNLYNEQYSELELIKMKKSYLDALSAYEEHLNFLRTNQKEISAENVEMIEKAELQIYKINLIRSMKEILIGFISSHSPDLLPQVQQFRTPVRRNLTLEDFNDTWDVGLTS